MDIKMNKVSRKDLKIFCIVWFSIFLFLFLGSILFYGSTAYWAIPFGLFFLLISFVRPTAVSGFYMIWLKVGEAIGGVISKVILVILFYGMITPFGLVFRIMRIDPLKKKLEPNNPSYWIVRKTQPGPLKNQF